MQKILLNAKLITVSYTRLTVLSKSDRTRDNIMVTAA